MDTLSAADLILNPDGSIYHLNLLPGEIAPTLILVGDPGRVKQVSRHFDRIEHVKENREFLTHTGTYKGKPLSVLSTGIGTDNIDIVVNELDALVNVDLKRGLPREEHRRLRLIRLGTSGALQANTEVGSRILSRVSCGFDGVLHFYKQAESIFDQKLSQAFMEHTRWPGALSRPYFVRASDDLASLFQDQEYREGITISTPGFYAPQVRKIRLEPFRSALIDQISSFRHDGLRIENFEMESSALYGLSALLGHEALCICVAVANRVKPRFAKGYKEAVDGMIEDVLDRLISDE